VPTNQSAEQSESVKTDKYEGKYGSVIIRLDRMIQKIAGVILREQSD
jgi:hypothetical protein